MQKVIITGTLGKDPELNQVGESQVCNMSVACNEKWFDKASGEKKERTEWFRCTAWGKMGETIAKYVQKGQEISIEGKMRTRTYEKDGQTRYATDLIVDNFEFRRGGSSDAPGSDTPNNPPPEDFDNDIPF